MVNKAELVRVKAEEQSELGINKQQTVIADAQEDEDNGDSYEQANEAATYGDRNASPAKKAKVVPRSFGSKGHFFAEEMLNL